MRAYSFGGLKVFLLILVTVGVLSACVQKPSYDSEEDSEDGKPVTYIGRSTGTNPRLPEGDTFEDNAYTRVAEEELDIDIRNAFEANGEDYTRQVSLAIASGSIPDMMLVTREELQDLAENDLIEDLSSVFDENASDYIKEVYQSFDNRPLEDATFDDKLMGLPGTEALAAPQMVWIREDWMEELGIEIDEDDDLLITLEELEMVAESFVEEDPGGSGNPVGIPFESYLTADNFGGSFTMNSIAAVFEGQPKKYLIEEDGSITYGSTSEGMKESLELMNRWYEKGLVDPQFGTRSFDDIISLLTNGQSGIALAPWHFPDWGLPTVREMNKEARFKPYALADEEGNVNVFEQNTTANYIVVKKGYDHAEKAVEMLNLYYDTIPNTEEKDMDTRFPEVAEYLELGVDNSTKPFNIVVLPLEKYLNDYHDVEDVLDEEITVGEVADAEVRQNINGIKEYTENPEGAQTSSWSSYHSRILGWGLMDTVTRNDAFKWVETAYVNDTATMEQKGPDLAKTEEEDFIKIITGVEDIDYFDVFVDKWSRQGGEDVLLEVEEAVKEQENQ
ncbi:extracellular solute-binding protein [Corticicoccus populi]|uniref:Extracellular solute-binding protein n=1 Tax=Corticicoccus populi TaxID=1812821 RepID=A0ABW5X0B7_9STAP